MSIKKTALYDIHLALDGKMVEFSQTWLPVRYQSERAEHKAVREAVGLFDVSHMGEFIVRGKDAASFLNFILTNTIEKLNLNQAQYSLLLNEHAGVVDDLIVYRLAENEFMLCVNAATIQKDWAHIKRHSSSFEVSLEDVSDEYSQLALQGKNDYPMLERLCGKILPSRFEIASLKLFGLEVLVARTGYTGEDGFEIFVKNKDAVGLWENLYSVGQTFSLLPCGLAARDSLRLEAGLLLYGQDMDESTTPLEARLMFAVDLKKPDFLGKRALLQQKKSGPQKKLIGFLLLEKGLARHGFKVINEKLEEIGTVTSGGMSPLSDSSFGLAYIKTSEVDVEKNIFITIRDRQVPAKITRPSFLKLHSP